MFDLLQLVLMSNNVILLLCISHSLLPSFVEVYLLSYRCQQNTCFFNVIREVWCK